MRATWIMSVALAVLLVNTGRPQAAENPFDVPDIQNPDGADAQALAKSAKLPGDASDQNAEQWVKEKKPGKKGSLDGGWFDRWNSSGGDWNYGKAPAQIKEVGDRVYILVNASNGRFLIDVKRDKNRLVGKYQGVDNPSDTGPCVFRVVDDERIDGTWAGQGRWDFRRKIR